MFNKPALSLLCLGVIPRAYARGKLISGAPLGLTHKYYIRLEKVLQGCARHCEAFMANEALSSNK
jgi:hypothetical protein